MKFLVSVFCVLFLLFVHDQPVLGDQCCGEAPRNIPTQCEVDTLITMLELAVSVDLRLSARWLRLAFHDAGTFDKEVPEGGANGCLLNFPPMRRQSENRFLNDPINTLAEIKRQFEKNNSTCIETSGADAIQFAGYFAVIRQMNPTGMTSEKREFLKNNFAWGRADEPDCDTEWTHNLPGFETATGRPIVTRCVRNGGEIKEKMMDRNGFTAEEATALIGAHTIGLTRFAFGPFFAAPWVENGGDTFTRNGPVFDNAFHSFLVNEIEANTCGEFDDNKAPFNKLFPNWFQQRVNDIPFVNHLDTDIAIAFPSEDTNVHPNFNTFTEAFAADNDLFMEKFLAAFDKMSKLGVTDTLANPATCRALCGGDETRVEFEVPASVGGFLNSVGYALGVADDENRQTVQELVNETEQLVQPFIPTAQPTPGPTTPIDECSSAGTAPLSLNYTLWDASAEKPIRDSMPGWINLCHFDTSLEMTIKVEAPECVRRIKFVLFERLEGGGRKKLHEIVDTASPFFVSNIEQMLRTDGKYLLIAHPWPRSSKGVNKKFFRVLECPTPSPTKGPTPAPTEPQCTDVSGWADKWGDGCDWWANWQADRENPQPRCGKHGAQYDNGMGSPSRGCCACGGGSLDTPPPLRCFDHEDYLDADGNDCDWYLANPDKAICEEDEITDKKPNCCVCGEGTVVDTSGNCEVVFTNPKGRRPDGTKELIWASPDANALAFCQAEGLGGVVDKSADCLGTTRTDYLQWNGDSWENRRINYGTCLELLSSVTCSCEE